VVAREDSSKKTSDRSRAEHENAHLNSIRVERMNLFRGGFPRDHTRAAEIDRDFMWKYR